jgi:hypothetical protein
VEGKSRNSATPGRLKAAGLPEKDWRRGSESNRRIKVLQTSPLPLGYRAQRQTATQIFIEPGLARQVRANSVFFVRDLCYNTVHEFDAWFDGSFSHEFDWEFARFRNRDGNDSYGD